MNYFNDYKYYIAGGFAGFCETIIGHPFDTIKVNMQTNKPIYFRDFCSLYKGVYPMFTAAIARNSILFGANDTLKIYFNPMIAAALTGVVESLIYCPLEMIKIEKQLGNNNNAIRYIYQRYGLMGFTRGMKYTMMRESIGNLFYFGTYDYMKRFLSNYLPKDQSIMLSGGFAGIAYWVGIYPIDTLKTWTQYNDQSGKQNRMKTVLTVNNIKSLYQGLSPCIIRAFPVNVITFYSLEKVLALFEK